MDGSGDLFGTTTLGGAYGDGDAFEITKNGSAYSAPTISNAVLLRTTAIRRLAGWSPMRLATCSVSTVGDANDDGVVFEIAKNGSSYNAPVVVASFNGKDGAGPHDSLIVDSSGDLFGTTFSGGADDDGVVFEIVKNGSAYNAPSPWRRSMEPMAETPTPA